MEKEVRHDRENVSKDSLSDADIEALKKSAMESGYAISKETMGTDGPYNIQTQDLNPKTIGPFDSMADAESFLGLDPDRDKGVTKLRAV
jgi:hypothetical protein